jgi:hypothetical protein
MEHLAAGVHEVLCPHLLRVLANLSAPSGSTFVALVWREPANIARLKVVLK